MDNTLKEVKSYLLKNNYTILFSVLAILFFIFGIFSLSKLNLGWVFLNQILSIFPTLFWFLFCISFMSSFFLAYKEKYKWMIWPIFIVLLIFTAYVRTQNIPQLKDITTGQYTLGPDLDPFLYLRNANEILNHTNTGKIDTMRYAPLGAESYLRSSLMPWAIVGLYKILSIFSNLSLNYAAIILPVVLFLISLIGFFLFADFTFSSVVGKKKSKIITILASFFYALTPQMLHRTTAGIPEIESLGMAFFWFAFLFFAKAWKEKETKKMIIFGIIAGIFTGLMSFSWGGYKYIYMILSLVSLIVFFTNKDKKKNLIIFLSWFLPAFIVEIIKFKTLSGIIASITTIGFGLLVLILLIGQEIIIKLKIKKLKEIKLSDNIKTAIIIAILGIIIFLVISPKSLIEIITKIVGGLLFPFGRSRVGTTIAENNAPYFIDAISQMGWIIWIFLISAFALFIESVRHFQDEGKNSLTKWILTANSIFIIISIVIVLKLFSPNVAANQITSIIKTFNLFLILEVISMIILFFISVQKERTKPLLLSSFSLFLVSITFTRFSGERILFNGNSIFSQIVFFIGLLIFINSIFISILEKKFRKNFVFKNLIIYNIPFLILFFIIEIISSSNKTLLIIFGIIYFFKLIFDLYTYTKLPVDKAFLEDLKQIKFSYIILLAFSFWAIISIRGAIRLFFIVSPISILVASYLPIKIIEKFKKTKDEMLKFIFGLLTVIIIILLLISFVNYSSSTIAQAKATVPGIYEQQWQKAMNWVKNSTPERSIFVHWWDYGYWVQTLGQRPTVTDGGHFIGYWDHLTGRYVLTTPYPAQALSFMKTHNVSYLLIDSTDIGKYSAFSSIGSDSTGKDRYSWIPTLLSDNSQMQETRNGTIRIYYGGSILDDDLTYNLNGDEIFLPSGKAGIGAVIIEMDSDSIKRPEGIFVYNGEQTRLPMRYVYLNGETFDFGEGVNSMVYLFPSFNQNSNGGGSIDNLGAAMYLSEKVKDGLVAKLYLMNNSEGFYNNFELVHTESDLFVNYLKSQGFDNEFVYYNGIRGPIKIWKVNYPENIITHEEFLRTSGTYAEFDNLTFVQN